MKKSYNSFKQIDSESKSLELIISKLNTYYGHTRDNIPPESLTEHIIKTKQYFIRLVEVHKLENQIDFIISRIRINEQIGNFVKQLFFYSIIFHDFGKINPNFQAYIGNSDFSVNNSIKIEKKHSFLSAYIFLNYFVKIITEENKFEGKDLYYAFGFIFLFIIPIIKHHSGYIEKDFDFEEEKINSIHNLISIFDIDLNFRQITNLVSNQERIWEKFTEIEFFPLFTLLKLNYSLLTASDYYATTEYMNDIEYISKEDFGLLTDSKKENIRNNFEALKKYNGELVTKTGYFLNYSLDLLQAKSFDNLNILRQKLGAEMFTNIEKHSNARVYYIEAPTGGGKTNMSMAAIYKLLQIHTEISKVFYVFPFTTLITQTNKAIKETFGLSENDIALLHSKAGYQRKEVLNEEVDALYGNEKRNDIDNLFVNYPFVLLTHIKFFDILKSNDKNTNYLLHRLANSVVIIDELQSYNPKEWDKVKYYISQYAELFNIRFILMSATLPKIDKIKLPFEEYKTREHFIPLIDNPEKYLQNPNFAQRVKINTGLLENSKIELDDLADMILQKSKSYAENRTDEYRNSVYTIVEFIFKKSASEFYNIINEMEQENSFFDEIFVLSGTIIEPRRKYIIEYLKDEENRRKKILLITTQVVEAGVDIDMDIGFKNRSLIDSDEQLAGRINRNVKKQNCELFLFNYNESSVIYGKDLRYKAALSFSNDYVKEILTEKRFGKLYNEVFKKIDQTNLSVFKTNFKEYLSYFKRLNFQSISNEFKLIDSKTVAVFVPADIPVKCYKAENNFSGGELNFIKQNECFAKGSDDMVSGEDIWTIFVSIVNNNDMPFAHKKRNLKILNGIMSKFVFSVFDRKIRELEPFLENSDEFEDYVFYGYYKMNDSSIGENRIYDLKKGLDENQLGASFEFI